MTTISFPPGTMDRFWRKVDKSGGASACWEWKGSRLIGGYGQFKAAGSNWLAHRVAFFGGPYTKKAGSGVTSSQIVVRHTCDNPHCCNPEHLRGGSHLDNMRDMVQRGRQPNSHKTECVRGHEFSAGNTYIDSRGWRKCRACAVISQRERRTRITCCHAYTVVKK
jgi:hypothetical protein